jgi:geranylgeranyl reductase family protein
LPDAFEVGIVGAGVAGSTCARVLGKTGVKVAIFDHSHPREKACGGLVDSRVIQEFDIPENLIQKEVKWFLAERFRCRAKVMLKPSAFLVSRRDFDHYLLQRTLENNSVTFFDEKVTQVTKSEHSWMLKTNRDRCVRVKALVGADGCPSLVRKCIFTPIQSRFLATTVGYNFTCPREYIEKAFPRNTVEAYYSHKYVQRGGFIWIFPKKTSINVGIGGIETGKKLKRSLNEFILMHPAGKRLRNLTGQFFAHLLPTVWAEDFFDLPCSGNDWALIGDAAGHVNPISGIGIYYAMKGGTLCGSAFLEGDMQLFDKYWRKEYGDELHSGAKTFSRFYSNSGLFLWLRYLFDGIVLARLL